MTSQTLTARRFPASIDCRYDGFLAPGKHGYLGADGALSVPLGKGKVFWLFGDTLIGNIRDGRRVIDGMPRNTIAIQDTSSGLPGSITWHWNPGGQLRSFFQLPGGDTDNWFWPGTGFMHEGELFLFGYRVTSGHGESEAMSFSVREQWVLRVRNPFDPPATWIVQAHSVDFESDKMWFCSAHVLTDEFVYLYGLYRPVGSSIWNARTSVARISRDSLSGVLEKQHFEFLREQYGMRVWGRECRDLAPAWHPAITEASVFYDVPRDRYVATTYVPRSPEFLVVTAPSPEGPWSEPVAVWQDADHAVREDLYSYTFRIHPHLAQNPDELVCTYAVNARDFDTLINEPFIYFPRFVRVDLTQVL